MIWNLCLVFDALPGFAPAEILVAVGCLLHMLNID